MDARRRRPPAALLPAAAALSLLVAAASAAAAASPPPPTRVAPAALCKSKNASATNSPPDVALLAAYAPFPDPGFGLAPALLPIISVRPSALDKWVRKADLFCSITPDAPGGANGVVLPPPALVTPALSLPHINSHGKAMMAAFHWCKLDERVLGALHGRGGSVRLVDAAEAAVLRQVGFDRGHAATVGATPLGDAVPGTELACDGALPFPAPLDEAPPPPGLGAAFAVDDGSDDGIPVPGGGGGGQGRPHPGALPPPAPSPPYERLAACVGPLYGSSAAGLISWFEHHLAAGVDTVYAYVVDEAWQPAKNPVHAVLAHYAARGVATVIDWSPVGGRSSPWASDAWYFNQPALHNDCLNRVRGRHRHALFLDTDEFVEAAGWAGVPDADLAAAAQQGGEPPAPASDAGALTRAIGAWMASPVYASTHSVSFPCRWRSMLGDGPTRSQLRPQGERDSPPQVNDTVLAAAAVPALRSHPPLAPSPCAEPMIDRLPYRAAKVDRDRAKFVAVPASTLAVEAHYVLHGAGKEATFADGSAWHNHYFIMKDGVAGHPTAPRPVRPGANASAPGGGLQVPVPAMFAVEDAAWPARFVVTGLRDRVVEVAAAACAGL